MILLQSAPAGPLCGVRGGKLALFLALLTSLISHEDFTSRQAR